MTFLSFRHAKRKAKKTANVRSPRSPSPSSGSFVTASVVEIGDPSSASAEAYYAPVTLHVDVDITSEPLFASDLFSSTLHRGSTTNSRQSHDQQSRSRLGGSSSRPLHDDAGWVQTRVNDGRVSGLAVVGDIIRTPDSRRATKASPAPIKIPITSHAPKLQIQRSAGKSADPHPTSGESPILEDTASAVSGISLFAAFSTHAQTDQPRDRHLSRRITRLDSATLPVDPFFQRYSGPNDGDGESPVPPMPLPTGVNAEVASRPMNEQGVGNVDLGDKLQTVERNSHGHLLRETVALEKVFSEMTTPDPSDSGTPDLTSSSADGGSSDVQPNTSSDSALSAWSGPLPSSSLAFREKSYMILDAFPAIPSDTKLPFEVSASSSIPSQAGLPTGERNDGYGTLLTRRRRTCATPEFRRRPLSRSTPRPSLASVNALLLHPTSLRPVSERRTSTHSANKSTASDRVEAPGDTNRWSVLSSPLPATGSRQVSQDPFPETAVQPSTPTSSGLSSSSSPPSSPDLLDGIVLAEGSREWQRPTSSESMSTMPTSGTTQTFPETPPVFSPMFSPGASHPWGRALSMLDSSTRQHTFATKTQQGRSSRVSQKFISGRSTSIKSSVGTKARRMSWRCELKRSSTGIRTPAMPSLLSTVTNSDVPNSTKSDQSVSGLSAYPQSTPSGDSPDTVYSGRHESESLRRSLTCPPLSQPPSPAETSNSTSPSVFSLPPPPPPPQLHAPPPPVSQTPAVSPTPSHRGLSPSPTLQAHPPSADTPSEDESQARIPLSIRSLPPPPLSFPSATVHSNPLAPPPALPDRIRVNLQLNAYNTDRPPRPLGPRGPYRNTSFIPGSRRGRFFSDSSVKPFPKMTVVGAQDLVSGRSGACCRSSSEPRFQTSPAKFKTLTMEAAKWTFSPEELHSLMSQAIRGSGQASSIRLLSEQAAFVEIPEELGRLNALLDELTIQYRLHVRKRNVLLRATYEFAESPEPSTIAFRSKLQELHETAQNLDRIAEEMYYARDQAAQLSRMLAVHSGSALAVALRNLHSSYLERTSDMQSLKDHVSALEAECDEAWSQAQQVAQDLDDLNGALQTGSSSGTRPTSYSSSRVVVSRQSSLRLSTAGLRLNHSQRTSMASSPIGSTRWSRVTAASSPPPSSGLMSPLPGMTRRRLASQGRIITSGLSDLSSSSGRRALVQAQADLYKCLGIDDPELMPRTARRSFIVTSPMAVSPVARDNADKARRRRSDITDHRCLIDSKRL